MKDRDSQQLTLLYEGVMSWVKSKFGEKDDFQPKYGPLQPGTGTEFKNIKGVKGFTGVRPPVKFTTGSEEKDIEQAIRQPFTAMDYALDHGHHPKLWQAVKDSPYASQYMERVTHGQNPESLQV